MQSSFLRWPLALSLVVLLGSSVSLAVAEELSVKKSESGVEVLVGDQPFTTYHFKSGAKPVLWPVHGPKQVEMTRAYPLREGVEGEATDHVHQRSFWFTHGDVDGVSFWHETEGHGNIVHKELVTAEGGETATIVTKNDWQNAAGEKLLEDVRTLRFGVEPAGRYIDFDIVLTASEKDVKFGDTKEGMFGLRIAESMRADIKDAEKKGRIFNSEGQVNDATWGKPAAWVDYSGLVKGEHVGIAILNHPTSFRYPTHWHVRTYGLFAANPFGLHDFKAVKEGDGSHVLKKGESISFRYRVIFHEGDEKKGDIVSAWERYGK